MIAILRKSSITPFCLLLYALIFSGCADKYRTYHSRYQFKSENGNPQYEDLQYWAAHPWKWDPSDSIPAAFANEKRDSLADVFFLHPTSYTKKMKGGKRNAPVDADYINAKTDYSSILYQASVFNQQSRIFAPRYRQAHISSFFTRKKDSAAVAFEIAYQDIRHAFEYYLQHWNGNRPIVIAAHSQGSFLAERLLKEFFENKPLQKQLVVAYIMGWPVPKEYFSNLSMCIDSAQTGCICSWRTLRKGFVPRYLKTEKGNSYVTNPLTWTTTPLYAARQMNKGSILFDFNKMYLRTTDGQISNGLLYVSRPKFPWSFLYFTRNYHIGDVNLFYANVRENVRQRITAFRSIHKQ